MIIPYGRQNITSADIDAVVEVLKSPLLTQGPIVPLFEADVSKYVGTQFGVAMNSATSALHAAAVALGLTKDDFLWTSPITFVASANCGLYCGAEIDFVDIDPRTFNICVDTLKAKLIEAEKAGKLPKILVVVHMAGQSANMRSIHALSQKYNFKIIEDASHAIGGSYLNQKVGSCQYSDVTVFSFHPVKIITTGEGGMALTNNKSIAQKMMNFRSHGITRDPDMWTNASNDVWYYEMQELGLNYRLTDLQAALGLSQLKDIKRNIDKRNELAQNYNNMLDTEKLVLPYVRECNVSAFHLYIIQLKDKKRRSMVFNQLRDAGIGVNVHYIPVHLQPYYANLGFKRGDFPKAEEYYEGALTIPLYPNLSSIEQDFVCDSLHKALN